MKRSHVFLLVVLVALVFGIGGYLLGTSHNSTSNDYIEAYKKGWSHWFSGYGMNGEGMKYIEYYEYGVNYKNKFEDTYDAFSAGYKDGFYYVYHNEPDDKYDSKILKAYIQYYPNSEVAINEKIVISSILINDNNSQTVYTEEDLPINQDTFNSYEKIIKSRYINAKVKEEYPNAGTIELEPQSNTSIINVIYVCGDNTESESININKAYVTAFSEYMCDNYNLTVSVVTDAFVTTRAKEQK